MSEELKDGDKCVVCHTKHFSEASWERHKTSKNHLKKVVVYEFLLNATEFEPGEGISSAATAYLASCENQHFLGLDCIHEFYTDGMPNKSEPLFWACSVCYSVNVGFSMLSDHLSSNQHRVAYINQFFPQKKPKADSVKELTVALDRVCSQLRQQQGDQTPEVLVLKADASVLMKRFQLTAENTTPASVNTTAENVNPTASESKMEDVSSSESVKTYKNDNSCSESDVDMVLPLPKTLSSDRNEQLIWCDDVDARFHCWWSSQISRFVMYYHFFNILLYSFSFKLLGIEDTIFKQEKNKETGEVQREIACLLCAKKIDGLAFEKHMSSAEHILQFLHKHDPAMVRRLAGIPENQKETILDQYFRKKTVRPGKMRNYDPDGLTSITVDSDSGNKKKVEKSGSIVQINQKSESKTSETTEQTSNKSERKKQATKSIPLVKEEPNSSPTATFEKREVLKKKTLKRMEESETEAMEGDAVVASDIKNANVPLIGVECVCEVQTESRKFWPSYYCRLCGSSDLKTQEEKGEEEVEPLPPGIHSQLNPNRLAERDRNWQFDDKFSSRQSSLFQLVEPKAPGTDEVKKDDWNEKCALFLTKIGNKEGARKVLQKSTESTSKDIVRHSGHQGLLQPSPPGASDQSPARRSSVERSRTRDRESVKEKYSDSRDSHRSSYEYKIRSNKSDNRGSDSNDRASEWTRESEKRSRNKREDRSRSRSREKTEAGKSYRAERSRSRSPREKKRRRSRTPSNEVISALKTAQQTLERPEFHKKYVDLDRSQEEDFVAWKQESASKQIKKSEETSPPATAAATKPLPTEEKSLDKSASEQLLKTLLGGGGGQQPTEALLLKLLMEEREKQRQQEQQQTALLALLTQNLLPKSSTLESSSSQARSVFDYGHLRSTGSYSQGSDPYFLVSGRQEMHRSMWPTQSYQQATSYGADSAPPYGYGRMPPPRMVGMEPVRSSEDELIVDAALNVLQSQQSTGNYVGSSYPRSMQQPPPLVRQEAPLVVSRINLCPPKKSADVPAAAVPPPVSVSEPKPPGVTEENDADIVMIKDVVPPSQQKATPAPLVPPTSVSVEKPQPVVPPPVSSEQNQSETASVSLDSHSHHPVVPPSVQSQPVAPPTVSVASPGENDSGTGMQNGSGINVSFVSRKPLGPPPVEKPASISEWMSRLNASTVSGSPVVYDQPVSKPLEPPGPTVSVPSGPPSRPTRIVTPDAPVFPPPRQPEPLPPLPMEVQPQPQPAPPSSLTERFEDQWRQKNLFPAGARNSPFAAPPPPLPDSGDLTSFLGSTAFNSRFSSYPFTSEGNRSSVQSYGAATTNPWVNVPLLDPSTSSANVQYPNVSGVYGVTATTTTTQSTLSPWLTGVPPLPLGYPLAPPHPWSFPFGQKEPQWK